jgi:hypothetical protein
MRITFDSDHSIALATWVWVHCLASRARRRARLTRRRATAGGVVPVLAMSGPLRSQQRRSPEVLANCYVADSHIAER